MPGLSCANRLSCFATSVPSAPSADPEKVRTVSCFVELDEQPATVAQVSRTSAMRIAIFTNARNAFLEQVVKPRKHELHGEIGHVPQLDISAGAIPDRAESAPLDLIAPQFVVFET